MRKSIVRGTKSDVLKRRANQLKLQSVDVKTAMDAAADECGKMIAAGMNPYLAVYQMDSKMLRIATGNHPGVFKYDE